MEEKNKREEIQSRREFFKKAAKAALPVVGAAILSSVPFVKAEATPSGCQFGCMGGCYGNCSGGCMGCSGGCTGDCQGQCGGNCTLSCSGGCYAGCTSANYY